MAPSPVSVITRQFCLIFGRKKLGRLDHRCEEIWQHIYLSFWQSSCVRQWTTVLAKDWLRRTSQKLECGPIRNVMAALPNAGGALCSMPQSLADAHYCSAVSTAAKMQNPLKLAGVPQTTGLISAASRPKFTILWGHLEEVLLLFSTVDMCLSCEDIARQSCTMVRRWRFFASWIFHEPRAARFRPAS